MLINFDDLCLLFTLNQTDYGPNTCFDYIQSIKILDDIWSVEIFVEPCGPVAKSGQNLSEILKWWIDVFSAQPKEMDYAFAGWHLKSVFDKTKFNIKPEDVWTHE